MLAIAAVCAVWAVGLVVLTTIGILVPASDDSDQSLAVKSIGAILVVLLTASLLWSIESATATCPVARSG
jgi:hypothetical protein